MTIKSFITDPSTGNQAIIQDESLTVTQFPSPPLMEQKIKIFSQFFTDDGTTSGSNDLGIDGSTTSVTFWVQADENNDRYITKLNFIMGYGASGELWEFADSNGVLTNGVKIFYENLSGEVLIANPTRNYSFLRFALTAGIIPTAWELRHLGQTNDYGYLCSIDLTTMMPPYGVKLDRTTTQKLAITIRDNCTDADTFNCRAFGFERFE